MNRGILILLALFIAAASSAVSMVHAQADKTASVKFDVQILSVDLSTDVVEVNITVRINDLPLTANLTPSEPVRAIVSSDFDHVEISCNETNGDYEGASGNIDWTLGGEFGKGEYFPFDRYELNFTLANVLPVLPNMTEIEGDRTHSFAYFASSKRMLLARIFDTTQVQERMYVEMSVNGRTAVVILDRKFLPGPIAAPVIFWQLMLPTIACYWLRAPHSPDQELSELFCEASLCCEFVEELLRVL
jgi:hypothetical protein